MESPLLSVVMPVFNERDTIDEIISRVLGHPDARRARSSSTTAPPTARGRTCGELQKQYGFTLLLQPHNQGKGAALRRGFAAVTGDIVAIQDADLEYSPEEFPDLVELIVDGPRRCRLRLAVPRASPRLPVHPLPREPGADADHQHPLQHDADGHGDLLQGHAARGAAMASTCSPTASASSRKSRRKSSSAAIASTRCRSPTTAADTTKARKSPGRTASSPSGCSCGTGSAETRHRTVTGAMASNLL